MYYECEICGNIYSLDEPIFIHDDMEGETFAICTECRGECVLVDEDDII